MKASQWRIWLALWLVPVLLVVSTIGAAAHSLVTPTALRNEMRKLWEDHITWTRLYIISAAEDLPDKDAAAQRLLQNQVDIGNAIKPYYGEAAGNQLSALLRDHILIAADVLTAAKAGDTAGVEEAKGRWYANADEIAAFLATANPQSWPLDHMQPMMRAHLDLTLQEAVDRLNQNWEAEIADYDQVHDQILEMADMLSAGIISQFPDKLAPEQSAPSEHMELRNKMRKLWEDHITWTRLYIISAAEDLPDKDAAAQRLLQNQVDIGNAIKPYYGEAAGNQLSALLRDHILIAADVLTAAKAGDTAGVDEAKGRWYANADEIAAFLATANPQSWPLDHMRPMMRAHLDLTLQEAVDRLNQNWEAEIAGYGKVHDQILEMADMLSAGIISSLAGAAAPQTLPTTGAHSASPSNGHWPALALLAGSVSIALAALWQRASRQGTVIQRLLKEFTGLPGTVQVGLTLLAAGGLLDLFYHALPGQWAMRLDLALGHDGFLAHLAVLVGMVVTLLGIVSRRGSVPVPVGAVTRATEDASAVSAGD